MTNLSIWTVYDHPKDYPDKYVARMFDGEKPTNNIVVADDIETIRMMMAIDFKLTRLIRDPSDDPCIVEVWL